MESGGQIGQSDNWTGEIKGYPESNKCLTNTFLSKETEIYLECGEISYNIDK